MTLRFVIAATAVAAAVSLLPILTQPSRLALAIPYTAADGHS